MNTTQTLVTDYLTKQQSSIALHGSTSNPSIEPSNEIQIKTRPFENGIKVFISGLLQNSHLDLVSILSPYTDKYKPAKIDYNSDNGTLKAIFTTK